MHEEIKRPNSLAKTIIKIFLNNLFLEKFTTYLSA